MRTSLILALLAAPVSAQAVANYGKGTAGTGSKTPTLWTLNTPRPNNPGFGLVLENGLPNALAVAYISQKPANFRLGGVDVLIDFNTLQPLPFVKLDANGRATYKIPVPTDNRLIGLTSYAQAYVADLGGASIGLSATAGLRGTVQRFGLLVGSRSSSDRLDRQVVVNTDTGRQAVVTNGNLQNGHRGDFLPSGTHCLIPSYASRRVTAWDCTVFPPRFSKSFVAQAIPWAVTVHPDGLRAYVVNQNSRTGIAPQVQVVWANPNLSTFGTAFPGGSIPLGRSIDMHQMEFSSDGNTGFIASLGLVSSTAELRRYDTRRGSPNYHKVTGTFALRGQFIYSHCRVSDTMHALASAALGAQATITLVDTRTMRSLASLGGRSFGAVVWNMTADPRGRYLYCCNSPSTRFNVPAGVVRIDTDPNSKTYRQLVNINQGFAANWIAYAAATSPAGDRLYVVAGAGLNNTFVGAILEYDTNTLKLVRRFSANGLGNMYNLMSR